MTSHFTSFDELKSVVDTIHMQRKWMDENKIYVFSLGEYTVAFAGKDEAEALNAYVSDRQAARIRKKHEA